MILPKEIIDFCNQQKCQICKNNLSYHKSTILSTNNYCAVANYCDKCSFNKNGITYSIHYYWKNPHNIEKNNLTVSLLDEDIMYTYQADYYSSMDTNFIPNFEIDIESLIPLFNYEHISLSEELFSLNEFLTREELLEKIKLAVVFAK